MPDDYMENDGDAVPSPKQIPDINPPPYGKGVVDGWVVEGLMNIQHSIGLLTSEVTHLRTELKEQTKGSRSDFRWTWGGMATGAVILFGALVAGYFRIEDRQMPMQDSVTRFEVKLDNLISKLPKKYQP